MATPASTSTVPTAAEKATEAFTEAMRGSDFSYASALVALAASCVDALRPLVDVRLAQVFPSGGGWQVQLHTDMTVLSTAGDIGQYDVGKTGAFLWMACRCLLPQSASNKTSLQVPGMTGICKKCSLASPIATTVKNKAFPAYMAANPTAQKSTVDKALSKNAYDLFLGAEVWLPHMDELRTLPGAGVLNNLSDDELRDHRLFADVVLLDITSPGTDPTSNVRALYEVLQRSWHGTWDGTLWEGHVAQKDRGPLCDGVVKFFDQSFLDPATIDVASHLTLAKLGKVVQYVRNVASHFKPGDSDVSRAEAVSRLKICVKALSCVLKILSDASLVDPRHVCADPTEEDRALGDMRELASKNVELADRVLGAWDKGATSVANVFARASQEDPFVLWIQENTDKLSNKVRMTEVVRRVQRRDKLAQPAALRELDGVELGDKIDALGPRASWAATWHGVPVVAHANVDDHGAVKEFETEDLLELGLEASIVAEIGHPGLLRIYGQFESKYIICDHVVTTLKNADVSTFPMAEQLAKLEKISIGAAANKKEMAVNLKAGSIAHQAASVLAVLETHRVVHRRLSPNCIFLTAEGIVRVGGLGMARTMPGAGKHTDVGGNGKYEALEVKNGKAPHTFASDLFSLGATLKHKLLEKYFDGWQMKLGVKQACDDDPNKRGTAKELAKKFC